MFNEAYYRAYGDKIIGYVKKQKPGAVWIQDLTNNPTAFIELVMWFEDNGYFQVHDKRVTISDNGKQLMIESL